MAHGRKRSFIAGLLVGACIVVMVVGGAAWYFASSVLEPGRPLFIQSVKDCTWEWARLPPLPKEAKGLIIQTSGGMFTRGFRASFYGEPSAISVWVKSCPGISDSETTQDTSEPGSVVYEYKAGGGAMYAELRHYPERGIIEIYTYWS